MIQEAVYSGIKRTFQNCGDDANEREEDTEVGLVQQTETRPYRNNLEFVQHFHHQENEVFREMPGNETVFYRSHT